MARSFRFGVHLWKLDEDWLAQVRRVEALGFSTITFTDHVVVPQLDPLVAASSVGAATTTLRTGSLVLDLGLRNPVLVAKAAASVHRLTGGRFELGVGAGYVEANFSAVGLPFPPGADRIARLEEAVGIIRSCWSEETTTAHGRFFDVVDAPRSLDEAVRLPILVGGGGPKAMGVAGRCADIVSMIPRQATGTWSIADSLADSTDERMTEKAAWARAAATAAGRDADELELNTMVMATAITDGSAAARAAVAEQQGVAPEATLDSSLFLVGSPAEVRDRLLARRERYGLTYYSLFDPGDDQLERIAAELIEPLASA